MAGKIVSFLFVYLQPAKAVWKQISLFFKALKA